jgi:hypothetical protein
MWRMGHYAAKKLRRPDLKVDVRYGNGVTASNLVG